jgi:serine/threonine protein kinase
MTRHDGDTIDRGGSTGEAGLEPRFAVGALVAKRYRIIRRIGVGGTGEVYEAVDTLLSTSVALKALNRAEAELADSLERFRRELLLARRVTHPNVIRNFDFGEHEDARGKRLMFFTMELLLGQSLETRLKLDGPLPAHEALAIGDQIAAGLDAAHGAGVIHRDIKPSNVMLLPAPEVPALRVVITDFGLARSDELDMVSLTGSGDVVGTPLYMSPEQVRAAPTTAATDVYSFGMVFYEMVTGKLPFTGDSSMVIALRRLKTPPTPVREHLPGLPASWETALHRCLDVDPSRRFARAGQFMAALRGEPLDPAPRGRFFRRKTGGK